VSLINLKILKNMKKLLMVLGFAAFMMSCGQSSKNQGMNAEDMDENTEVVTPQPEDSLGGFETDSLSTDDDLLRQPSDSI
jgi:hypothetical protein